MRSAPLLLVLSLLASACTSSTPPPNPVAASGKTLIAPSPSTAPTPTFAERIITDAGITATVRYPPQALLGGPIPVTFTLVNHGHRTIWITYSDPIRFVSPAVLWPAGRRRLPYTARGENRLGNREETNNKTGPLAPGDKWSHTFDVTDYYQIPLAHKYYLTTSTTLECRDAADTDAWIQFDIGGMIVDVKERR